jgi:gamma-glutamylcyclotransferase (GGCT)/AIG2-like uncharacterized protein YtfP
MPVYFAYGSNMDAAAMARRCPRSKMIGLGRLARHRFTLMPEGYATVVRDPRRTVHGVLWDLALADVRALDAYEEIGRGLYRKVIQPVIKVGGGAVQALVYVGRGEGGQPVAGYLEGVIEAGRAADLPAPYLSELTSLAPRLRAAASADPAPVGPRVRPRFATPFDRG